MNEVKRGLAVAGASLAISFGAFYGGDEVTANHNDELRECETLYSGDDGSIEECETQVGSNSGDLLHFMGYLALVGGAAAYIRAYNNIDE